MWLKEIWLILLEGIWLILYSNERNSVEATKTRGKDLSCLKNPPQDSKDFYFFYEVKLCFFWLEISCSQKPKATCYRLFLIAYFHKLRSKKCLSTFSGNQSALSIFVNYELKWIDVDDIFRNYSPKFWMIGLQFWIIITIC